MNRETWLNQLATLMAPRFEELGHPLPKFRVAIGWPSGGKDAPVTGECWDKSVSGDQHCEIFLNPGRDDMLAVASTLAHELVHAAVGLNHGHKGDFSKVAKALGFKAPLTKAQEPANMAAWLQPMLDQLGPLPHAAINYSRGGDMRVKRNGAGVQPVDGGDGDEGGGPANNRPPKQSTRLLKAACTGENQDGTPCGYTVRLSNKWAVKYGACCPIRGSMEVEGADELGGDDDADQ